MDGSIGYIGYCTNVHAGEDLLTTMANLEKHATEVRRLVSPDRSMGIGLWLSARTTERLLSEQRLAAFADWLNQALLIPYTLNGFPYGDFHDRIVKHRVYFPTWWEAERLKYTLDLIAVQHHLLPPGLPGTISTLPIAWGQPAPTHEQLRQAATHLSIVAQHLRDLEHATGRYIRLCLEPEPGCYLQRSADVIRFFQDYLNPLADVDAIYRHIQVCHDICHAAVMFESQHEIFRAYQAANISIGKIQVSAAVATPDLTSCSPDRQKEVLTQLGEFHEERYLHQTVLRERISDTTEFYEDLPIALAAWKNRSLAGQIRVHFHVPIYADDLGLLHTTQKDIIECVSMYDRQPHHAHWEIETYAWSVLPPRWRRPTLVEGIATEIKWFQQVLTHELDGRATENL
jgi:hypothetical protein